jgi:Na+/melibiose symporter-like transporter
VTFISFVYLDDPSEIQISEDAIEDMRGKVLSESEVQRCFLNCLLIFAMQMLLTFYCLINMLQREEEKEEAKDPKEIEQNLRDTIKKHSFNILLTRYICATILHLNIEAEVE